MVCLLQKRSCRCSGPTTRIPSLSCCSLCVIPATGFRMQSRRSGLRRKCFRGGVKTKAGKSRIVPIHSAILPLVERRIARDGELLHGAISEYRKHFKKTLTRLGILGDPEHTPQDCRHTFSMLCERYKVSENDRKRMMGHSFTDVTNRVYGHRDLNDLRSEIEKIKAVTSVTNRPVFHIICPAFPALYKCWFSL